MNHPSFESDFRDVVKNLPDLERIVSRIHANNCRVKDFMKVLSVRFTSFVGDMSNIDVL
jgi:DNA mismatch repair protein MSH6